LLLELLLLLAVAVRLLAVAVDAEVAVGCCCWGHCFLKASFLQTLSDRAGAPITASRGNFPGSHRVEDRVFQKSSIETTSEWGIRVRRNSRSIVQTVVLREQFAQHAETG
jgi:hypothetical protein